MKHRDIPNFLGEIFNKSILSQGHGVRALAYKERSALGKKPVKKKLED